MAIFVIGLGPGDSDSLTMRAQRFLETASIIHVRTRTHPAVEALPSSALIYSFDSVVSKIQDPHDVDETIAQTLIAKAHTEPVIYAVPGHPLVGEPAVMRLLALAREQNIPLEIIGGLSFIEPAFRLLQRDLLADGLQIVDAAEIIKSHYPCLDPDRPALIAAVSTCDKAVALRVKLAAQYPPQHEVQLIRAADVAKSRADGSVAAGYHLTAFPLSALDGQDGLEHMTTLYVPPLARPSGLASFAEIIAHLRAPEGCPWDREQTPQTLRRYLLEEAYEALEAIDLHQPQRLKEELGDLLLQIVLQSQIASEQGDFTLSDVIANIYAKIIRRHPHVFGELKGATMQQIEENWEKIKRSEKEEGAEVASFFRDIPRGLPALTETEDMQQRAWRVNLWNGTTDEADTETVRALNQWHTQHDSVSLGQALFMLVDQARRAGLDAESALREANQRFREKVS